MPGCSWCRQISSLEELEFKPLIDANNLEAATRTLFENGVSTIYNNIQTIQEKISGLPNMKLMSTGNPSVNWKIRTIHVFKAVNYNSKQRRSKSLRISSLRAARFWGSMMNGGLMALRRRQEILWGFPTLMVPSPFTESVGRLKRDVGCWGGFPGWLWDMRATSTLFSPSGRVSTTTRCLPTPFTWVCLWVLVKQWYQDNELLADASQKSKCFGLPSMTLPIMMIPWGIANVLWGTTTRTGHTTFYLPVK